MPSPEAMLAYAAPSALQQILHAGLLDGPAFDSGDCRGILRHQLDAPIIVAAPDDHACEAQDEALSFRSALMARPPRRERLNMIRQYAKRQVLAQDQLPEEVALVLYYAAIAAGIIGLGEVLTSLAEGELRSGLAWAANRPWIDPQLQTLLSDATQRL